jgi:hypothetical protein
MEWPGPLDAARAAAIPSAAEGSRPRSVWSAYRAPSSWSAVGADINRDAVATAAAVRGDASKIAGIEHVIPYANPHMDGVKASSSRRCNPSGLTARRIGIDEGA